MLSTLCFGPHQLLVDMGIAIFEGLQDFFTADKTRKPCFTEILTSWTFPFMEFYSSSTPYFLCTPSIWFIYMVATWDFHALERERL